MQAEAAAAEAAAAAGGSAAEPAGSSGDSPQQSAHSREPPAARHGRAADAAAVGWQSGLADGDGGGDSCSMPQAVSGGPGSPSMPQALSGGRASPSMAQAPSLMADGLEHQVSIVVSQEHRRRLPYCSWPAVCIGPAVLSPAEALWLHLIQLPQQSMLSSALQVSTAATSRFKAEVDAAARASPAADEHAPPVQTVAEMEVDAAVAAAGVPADGHSDQGGPSGQQQDAAEPSTSLAVGAADEAAGGSGALLGLPQLMRSSGRQAAGMKKPWK